MPLFKKLRLSCREMPLIQKSLFFILIALVSFKSLALTTMASNKSKQSLTILTYNILDDGGLFQQRGKQVMALLAQHHSDILLLQEVNLAFLKRIKQDNRFANYDIYFKAQGQNIRSGLVILIKKNNSLLSSSHQSPSANFSPLHSFYHTLPSSLGRGLLGVKIITNSQTLCIANVHLESMLEDTPVRIQQLQKTFDTLSGCEHIVLGGDFNFGDNEAENSTFPTAYIDIWPQLHPHKAGLTYHREINPLSDNNAFWFEKSRRLDRVYLLSHCLKPAAIQLIGNQKDANGRMPSDHFGLVAKIDCHFSCKLCNL